MSLPITKNQAFSAVNWMMENFSDALENGVDGTPFDAALLCAIACQETAIYWLSFIENHDSDTILQRCVLDASGDYPGTGRSVFPKNTRQFIKKYGIDFANMLIEEANITRAMRGFSPKQWVYKGYGIFQYDLQYVDEDEAFFSGKEWYSFDNCLERAVRELTKKYSQYQDLWKTVKAYNGSGMAATRYANNVMQYYDYAREVTKL